MTSPDLSLVELAVQQGLIPSEALDRARRDCRGRADEWLLAEKLVTRDQLRDLLEDGLPPLPRAAGHDSSWAVLVFLFVILGAAFSTLGFLWLARPAPRPAIGYPPSKPPTVLSPTLPAVERLLNEAEGHWNFSESEAALKAVEEALLLEPLHEPSHLLRASILVSVGRAPEAVVHLEKLPPSPERDRSLERARKSMAEKK